ncbi:efflux RND transporter periplasmic adaptor subunit [Aromatoleum buckelii]|uniref:Efflux RND transporter periplasmic adaptor subunit n=1 Tax=Aromatoleum buckelii TaxID=200254 RepID=A0ABX1MUV0_9RHOO|nr:efflux RND transporter periplasmic adaptor subunit [Aromatoleum buckelii]MCK0510569.1 efflux RND transporter periplasmic adaptor subunit [Aromatoleum buckelii]
MMRFVCLAVMLSALLSGVATAAGWSTRPLSEVAVYPEFRASAHVVAVDEARIAAEVSGRIESLPTRVGQAVAKGAELARIDAAAYRIEVERAAAQSRLVGDRVRLAEAQLDQARALASKGFISADALRIRETELAVLKSELDAARQEVAAARLQLARTTVRAPFAGVVRERIASVGDLAVPGTPLLVLSASADSEVRARVPTAQIESLRAAGKWQFVAGGTTSRLTLLRVSAVVEAAGQARNAVFSSATPLPAGLAGEVRWTGATPHLPAGYVQQRGGALGAYVERGGRAVFIELPDAQVGRPVAVNWTPDTRIVDEGRFSIGLGRDLHDERAPETGGEGGGA